MDSYKIKPIKHYRDIKNIFKKEAYSKIWRSIAGRTYVGGCSAVFDRYRPNSYDEFLNYYINDRQKTHNDENSGRTLDELMGVAKEYQKRVNDYTIPIETYFDNVIDHVIIETYNGKKNEEVIKRFLTANGFEIIDPIKYFPSDFKSKNDIDAVLGVDIITKSKKGLIYYLQIKPISLFINNTKYDIRTDRKNFFEKQNKLNDFIEKVNNDYGCNWPIKEILYLVYDVDDNGSIKWIYNERNGSKLNGTIKFYLKDLCYKDNGFIVTPGIFNFKKKTL